MAYTRLDLQNGDKVYAEHVEHIEDELITNEQNIESADKAIDDLDSTKADKNEIPDLSDLTEQVEINKTNISSLTASISEKANQSDVDSLKTQVQTNTDDISSLQTEIAKKADSSDLAKVATSGSYNDLTDTPTIPDISDLETQVQTNTTDIGTLKSKSDEIEKQVTQNTNDIADLKENGTGSGGGTVDLSGIEQDIKDLQETKADKSELEDVQTELSKKADSSSLAKVATSGAYSDLSGTPDLAKVATSGSYNDLTDTPDLTKYASAEDVTSLQKDVEQNTKDIEDLKENGTGSGGSGSGECNFKDSVLIESDESLDDIKETGSYYFYINISTGSGGGHGTGTSTTAPSGLPTEITQNWHGAAWLGFLVFKCGNVIVQIIIWSTYRYLRTYNPDSDAWNNWECTGEQITG